MDMRSHSTSPWGRVHGTVSSPSSIQPDCSSRVFLSPASTLLPLVTTSCGYTTMGRLPKFYNTYLTAFVATIGGSLFGFDISSMSAIIGTTQYNAYFNTPSSTFRVGSRHPWRVGRILARFLLGTLPIAGAGAPPFNTRAYSGRPAKYPPTCLRLPSARYAESWSAVSNGQSTGEYW